MSMERVKRDKRSESREERVGREEGDYVRWNRREWGSRKSLREQKE